ncbi:helix-turn-helix domain-containing protein [Citricoccus sp. NPDC055426]|uniref:helix-turn-helix domain-containing protein n=1 Tax=Citricoccus sp. NPDC055426 TaxID=3155536 RepID=UPI003421DB63
MTVRTRPESPEQGLISLTKAAEMFGVSTKTIRRRIADGTVRGYRIGRLIRVDVEEIRDALVVEMPNMK